MTESIRAFCVDFNWDDLHRPASPGLYAHADPRVHVDWYLERAVNVIQSFCVSYNGYAWYRGSSVAPVTPGLKHDFLPELIELGHAAGVRVMGYFCVASNPWWSLHHRGQTHRTPNPTADLPLSQAYLDHLVDEIEDVLGRMPIDGFMLDWFHRPKLPRPHWLEVERQMWRELMDEDFPSCDRPNAQAELEFDRRAIDRAWGQVRDATRAIRPDAVIWTNHPLSANEKPLWEGSRLLREVDWLLNEGPDLELLEWTSQQIGELATIVQCLGGWGSHDAATAFEHVDLERFGLYGFAKADAGTTLPSEATRPTDYRNAEALGAAYRKLRG